MMDNLLQSAPVQRTVAFVRAHPLFCTILLLGIILRIIYVLGTPHSVREHDVWGHIDYIKYVSESWSIPPPHENSQFYHPPLYYFGAAAIYVAGQRMMLDENSIFFVLQLFSLLLSIGTLAVALWIGQMLLPERKHSRSFLLYGLLFAAFPSLIFFAARINNDVPYHFVAFLGLALILRAVQRKHMGDWVLLSIVLGLGLLVKTHIILLLPVAYGALLAQRKLAMGGKIKRIALSLVIVAACGGWFHAARYFDERNAQTTLVGNVGVLTNFVDNSASAYTTFHPLELLQHPYNDPFRDSERRNYFWEYFFRSAFSGEYNLGPERRLLMQAILVLSYVLSAFIAVSLIVAMLAIAKHPHSQAVALLLAFAIILGGSVAFRIAYPYSSAQDFRYAILLLIPLAWAASIPIPGEKKAVREIRTALILTLSVLLSALIISLSFG